MERIGGWSKLELFTSEDKKKWFEARKEIEKQLKTEFKYYFPLVYRSRIVEGTNYLIKVLVNVDGAGECVHAQIWQDLSCGGKLTVTGVEQHKTIDDPLIPLKPDN